MSKVLCCDPNHMHPPDSPRGGRGDLKHLGKSPAALLLSLTASYHAHIIRAESDKGWGVPHDELNMERTTLGTHVQTSSALAELAQRLNVPAIPPTHNCLWLAGIGRWRRVFDDR